MEYYFDGEEVSLTDRIDEGIIKTIMQTTEVLLDDPKNYDARANFALSTTLALNGVSGLGHKGGDWSSHAIEHALSALNPDVAHGAGLAVVFPAWMKYVCNQAPERFVQFGENIFGLKNCKPEEAINALSDWYKKIGAPTTLKELGFKEEDIEKLTEIASKMAPMGRLKKLERDDIKKILEIAY
jgi:hypothetical protein